MQMEEGLAQECSGLVLPWADVARLTEAQKVGFGLCLGFAGSTAHFLGSLKLSCSFLK